jgi:hypothetical protein
VETGGLAALDLDLVSLVSIATNIIPPTRPAQAITQKLLPPGEIAISAMAALGSSMIHPFDGFFQSV